MYHVQLWVNFITFFCVVFSLFLIKLGCWIVDKVLLGEWSRGVFDLSCVEYFLVCIRVK